MNSPLKLKLIESGKGIAVVLTLLWFLSSCVNKRNEESSDTKTDELIYVCANESNDTNALNHTRGEDYNIGKQKRNQDLLDTTNDGYRYTDNDTVIDCIACGGTGLSYATQQTDFLDRDMISASAGLHKCEVCLGKKKLKKTEAITRWKAIMAIYADIAVVEERLRNTCCPICGGDGKCWQCEDMLPYRNSDCYCRGSGLCDICHGSGHM